MTEHLRAHLEAIRDRHYKVQWIEPNNLGADDSCSHGGDGEWNLHPWPCPDYSDAVAALDILNKANYTRRDGWPTTRYAYIRDPEHPDDAVYPKLPDPVPGATIATRETHT